MPAVGILKGVGGGGEEMNGVVSSPAPSRPTLPFAAQISYLWS